MNGLSGSNPDPFHDVLPTSVSPTRVPLLEKGHKQSELSDTRKASIKNAFSSLAASFSNLGKNLEALFAKMTFIILSKFIGASAANAQIPETTTRVAASAAKTAKKAGGVIHIQGKTKLGLKDDPQFAEELKQAQAQSGVNLGSGIEGTSFSQAEKEEVKAILAKSTKEPKETITDLLNSKAGRQFLRIFSQQNFSLENPQFLDSLRLLGPNPSKAALEHIYDTYIQPKVPMEVNLSDTCRQQIDRAKLTQESFNQAGAEVLQVLATNFQQQKITVDQLAKKHLS